MKNIIQTIVFLTLAFISQEILGQCPADPSAACTSTISTSTAAAITANAGDVICITGGTQSGAVTVNNGGIIIVSGGTVNNQIAVQNGGNLVVSGGTLNNSASLPAGAQMFIKNNPTLNNTLAMSGGTLNVLSSGTLSKNISPTAASTINNCGTISGTPNFNSNVTLNNYSSTAFTLNSNRNILNNYANNVTITYNSPATPGAFTNYGTAVNFNITGSWNAGFPINNQTGASAVMTMPGANVPGVTTFNNSGIFTVATAIGGGSFTVNNSTASTFNFASNGSSISPTINNNGTINVTGNVYFGGGTTNNNNGASMNFSGELRVDGGTLNLNAYSTTTTKTLYKNNGSINMGDHSLLNITDNITTFNGSPINLVSGCATILASTMPSTVNGTVLNNSNLNFCGAAPTQTGGTINTITSVADNGSGAYRITMASGPNTNQFINITGVTGVSNLNGYWQVIRINATTFDLVGSSYTPGAVFGSSQVQVSQSNLRLGTSTYLGYSGCANPCAPLPVKLISFTATKEGENVKVAWQTAEEKNNLSYTIERSSNGMSFESIHVIAGNRNSSSIQLYTIYDFNPVEGTTYYRLKQTDYDGTVAYSSIAVVNFDKATEWNVFPNPSTDGSFTIQSDFADADIIAVTVTDVTDHTIRSYNAEAYKQSLEVNGLTSGLYIVSIQSVAEFVSKKLVVK